MDEFESGFNHQHLQLRRLWLIILTVLASRFVVYSFRPQVISVANSIVCRQGFFWSNRLWQALMCCFLFFMKKKITL